MIKELSLEYNLNEDQIRDLKRFNDRMDQNMLEESLRWILQCVIEEFISGF